jgi:hypothetical protein
MKVLTKRSLLMTLAMGAVFTISFHATFAKGIDKDVKACLPSNVIDPLLVASAEDSDGSNLFIVSFLNKNKITGGESLISIKKSKCTLIATDTSIFPLKRWGLSEDVALKLAKSQFAKIAIVTKAATKPDPNPYVITGNFVNKKGQLVEISDFLAPEQLIAIKEANLPTATLAEVNPILPNQFTQGTYSESIYYVARASVNKFSTANGPRELNNGRRACAYAVSTIVEKATGIKSASDNLTTTMADKLASGAGKPETEESVKRGDIIISPTIPVSPTFPGIVGHVGICMKNKCEEIASNSSGEALFKITHKSLSAWKRDMLERTPKQAKGKPPVKLSVLFFSLK